MNSCYFTVIAYKIEFLAWRKLGWNGESCVLDAYIRVDADSQIQLSNA